MNDGTFWMPPQASTFAEQSDPLFYFILAVSTAFFVVLMYLSAKWAIVYRRKSENQRTSPIKHNTALEFFWSAVPTVLLLVIFAWGQKPFVSIATPPAESLELRVRGMTWNWQITYPSVPKKKCKMTRSGGKARAAEGEFVVPVGRPVSVTLSSSDVLHSFWIPAFRLKRDAVPNRYTGYWFEATMTGKFRVFCAEYCGQDHSRMSGWIDVVDEAAWQKFVSGEDQRCELDPNDPDFGLKVFEQNCSACHSMNGVRGKGPALNGLYGKQEKLSDGTSVAVDDNYIRQSIEAPNSQVVAGFEPVMPTFKGQLSDAEIDGLIDYLKKSSTGE